jgi:MFS superfamily sulfate permease-like transporter
MISNIIYSMLGVVLTGKRFGLWPYSMVHVKMTLVGVAALAAGYLMPQISLITDIIVRSLLVTVIFTAGVWFLKLSDDLNGVAESLMERFRRKL